MPDCSSLPDRAVLRIDGDDAHAFLQGIITNDMGKLQGMPCLFSAMLSAQGKFQHDFFIFHRGDHLLLETESASIDALMKKLKLYKLRSKVNIRDVSDDYRSYAVWGKGMSDLIWPEGAIHALDPRLGGLGMRALNKATNNHAPNGAASKPFAAYDAHRLSLGVPDGSRDAGERNVLLELGYDQLNGVSFDKGCYVGQEVTARMHYRHVLHKCLYMVTSASGALPASGTPLMAGGNEIGEMRSSCGGIGLAQLRIAEYEQAQAAGHPLTGGDIILSAQLPPYMHAKVAQVKQAAASSAASGG